jgi:hypothetical protein
MLKAVGMTMLVAGLVFGLALVVVASPGDYKKEDSASVSINASFSIPSWISLSVVGNGDVSFGEVAGGGGYQGNNETELRVVSTTSWALSSTILWNDSTMPDGVSQSIIEKALDLSFDKVGGSWGVHSVNVSYKFDVSDDDMAELPVGDYNLVIQYTATTD